MSSACELQCDQDYLAILQGERFARVLDSHTGKAKRKIVVYYTQPACSMRPEQTCSCRTNAKCL